MHHASASPAGATPTEHTVTCASQPALDGRRALLARYPDGRVETHDLPRRGVIVIGRDPSADVVLVDASISRVHARLGLESEPWLEDAGSKNGVRVGGAPGRDGRRRIAPGSPFYAGDVQLTLVSSGGDARPLALTLASHHAVAVGYLERQLAVLDRIADTDLSVLVTGETGVGKDVLAELLHARSRRASAPFVRVHCAALSQSLLESELFGHEKGAFTDAASARVGLLESADGGTVLLDEIGEVSLAVQVKLLRVLEDGRVLRVGASRPTRVDVRFVAATHRDLAREVDAGRFRRDLFYRLAGMRFHVPPLRERRDEISSIAGVLLARAAARDGRPVPSIDPSFFEALAGHSFPGNVRELRNIVDRALVLSGGGALTGDHVTGLTARRLPSMPPADDPVARIRAALEQCAGNQTRAARLLGVSRRTLVSWLALHRIPRPTDPRGLD